MELAEEFRSKQDLLARLRAFCFPGGEEAARRVRAIKVTEQGELRSAPNARWVSFTSEQEVEARSSRFHWDARFRGGLGFFTVTDAYEDGHGYVEVKAGRVIPVKKMAGPEFDQGELQRYLASVGLCPAMLVNHVSLEWMTAGLLTLRVRDSKGPAGATVDLEMK